MILTKKKSIKKVNVFLFFFVISILWLWHFFEGSFYKTEVADEVHFIESAYKASSAMSVSKRTPSELRRRMDVGMINDFDDKGSFIEVFNGDFLVLVFNKVTRVDCMQMLNDVSMIDLGKVEVNVAGVELDLAKTSDRRKSIETCISVPVNLNDKGFGYIDFIRFKMMVPYRG